MVILKSLILLYVIETAQQLYNFTCVNSSGCPDKCPIYAVTPQLKEHFLHLQIFIFGSLKATNPKIKVR